MRKRIQTLLIEDRGDATYTGVIVFTVIAMITIVLMLIGMYVVIMISELDGAADQVE